MKTAISALLVLITAQFIAQFTAQSADAAIKSSRYKCGAQVKLSTDAPDAEGLSSARTESTQYKAGFVFLDTGNDDEQVAVEITNIKGRELRIEASLRDEDVELKRELPSKSVRLYPKNPKKNPIEVDYSIPIDDEKSVVIHCETRKI